MAGAEQRFWTAMESVPGLCAVVSEWKALLGPDYEAARAHLRPDGRLAGTIPCPTDTCTCCHDVVQHGMDDIVTVCRCEPRECPTKAIARADLVLYEVDRRGVCDAVARAIDVTPEHAAVSGLPMTWAIGTYAPRAGFRFPIYLTIHAEPDESERVIDALLRREQQPFVVAVPTRGSFRQAAEDGLRRRQGHLLVLAESLLLGPTGSFARRQPVPDLLAPFLAMVLPDHAGLGVADFKVPTFRQNGDHWSVWFDDAETTIKDGVGPRYIALLLANPGQRVHVIDMQLAEAALSGRVDVSSLPAFAGDPDEAGFDLRRTPATSGGPAADRLAVRNCRARLEEIDQALASAEAGGAPGDALDLREEAEQIARYISAVVDLRGRPRPSADDDDRARQSVTKAISRTIDGLSKKKHPQLARHLRKHLETGFTCLYHPDPPVAWVTQ